MKERQPRVDGSTVSASMRDADRVDRLRRRLTSLIACLLAFSGCSLNDTLKMADAQEGLRDQAHAVRELAEETIVTGSSRTSASLAADVISQIPSEPKGHLLSATTAQDRVRADVAIALTGKVDGYGPSGGTETLRLCVLFTAEASPAPRVTMADLDCPPGLPTVDEIVHLT